jgi:hypothetical protein
MRYGLLRDKSISQAPLPCGGGHKLRHSLRTSRTYRERAKPAFNPKQPRQYFGGY